MKPAIALIVVGFVLLGTWVLTQQAWAIYAGLVAVIAGMVMTGGGGEPKH